jgi:hypothetical protein
MDEKEERQWVDRKDEDDDDHDDRDIDRIQLKGYDTTPIYKIKYFEVF